MDWFVVGVPTLDEDRPVVAKIDEADDLPRVALARIVSDPQGVHLGTDDDDTRLLVACAALKRAWLLYRDIPF